MRTTAILIACTTVLLTTPLYGAQLYRWVDEKGNVEWRDTPPPATAKKVEQRSIHTSTIPASELPYSLQLAVKQPYFTTYADNGLDITGR